jgi:hypothetical protein
MTATALVIAGLATATAGSPAGLRSFNVPTRDVATPVATGPVIPVGRPSVEIAVVQGGSAFSSSRSRRYSAEVVRTWHALATAQPTNPVRQSRVLALVHAAMHDAVNGAVPRYEVYASRLMDRTAHPEAAAAAAAYQVLLNLFPANATAFDVQLANSLDAIRDGAAKDAGVALGSAVGQFIVDIRADDGMEVPDPFNPPPGPGIWAPTPPAFASAVEPQMQNVTPFSIRSRDQFEVEPPPSLFSEDYTRNYDEVKTVGRDTSTVRNDDQTHYAHFWFEPSSVSWSRIAAIYTLQKRTGLHETARLFALLNMAMADGYIAGFYWKRTHALWRPITAIRQADTDGNLGTEPDLTWNPLRPTPPSAEYPSTHAVLGSAAAQILRRFTGSDRFAFCMASSSSVPTGSARCYERFSEAAAENADSRVFIGYHFRFATQSGMRLGRQIGNFAFGHSLEPLRARHRQ